MAEANPQAHEARWKQKRAYAMALVFGVLSVPWTFGFEQIHGLPLWPSFIASASFFATEGGLRGAGKSLAGNLLGAIYGAATLGLVAWVGLGTIGLSFVVGSFMLLASLHALLPALSFTPAAFLGYASLFGVHEAAVRLALPGVGGELLAAGTALVIGGLVGLLAENLTRLASSPSTTLSA